MSKDLAQGMHIGTEKVPLFSVNDVDHVDALLGQMTGHYLIKFQGRQMVRHRKIVKSITND